jgi:hypothetical protein
MAKGKKKRAVPVAAPVEKEDMIAMLQGRLATLQVQEAQEAERKELEEKVHNPQSAEEAVDSKYMLLAEQLGQLNFKRRQAGELNKSLLQSFIHEGLQCKALPAQFHFKENAAHDAARASEVHHRGGGGGGSHYNMAGTKQFLAGLRLKGVVARHSKQAAKRNGPTVRGGASGPPVAGKQSKKSRLRNKASMAREDI